MGCGASSKKYAGACDQEIIEFLSKVPLFKRLPEEELPTIAKTCTPFKKNAGVIIIEQGEEGNAFFLIKSGDAKVVIDGKDNAILKKGDWFGETALLRDETRGATVIAVTAMDMLKITRADFVNLALKEKIEWKNRGAVAGGAGVDAAIKEPVSKTVDEVKLITAALNKNTNLSFMVSLDETKINSMIDVMWKESVKQNAEIIKQGDVNADYFYVINTGTFKVSVQSNSSLDERVNNVGTLEPGTSFGELALVYSAPRAATVTAETEAEVFVIARQQFKKILSKIAENDALAYVPHLNKVGLLDALTEEEKKQLAKALIEKNFKKDDTIFEQGEEGDFFYILIDGEVAVLKDNKEVTKLKAATVFGERALANNEKRDATIKVVSDAAIALGVDKKGFDMLLGPLTELQKRGKGGTAEVNKVIPSAGQSETRAFGVIKHAELKNCGLLGCGGFGSVEMVEHTTTREFYALKSLSKGYVVKTGMQKSVMSEKDVQLMCDSTFIVKLHETYNRDQYLLFLLELAQGGELYATYNRKNLWGREDLARFYVAGTVFAFDHLHARKIIYRDLKPENLLLNEKGQVKLTDMGLAKVVVGKTYTTCGTPDYFAPELIRSKGHGEAVDWWTLGILNFELLAGNPPFESSSPQQIYQKVTKGIDAVVFPKKCKGEVEKLIKGNCKAHPPARLPMTKGGSENIKKHAWYKGFNWQTMGDLTMRPPYEPQIRSKNDASNFSARKEDKPPEFRYKDDKSGWDKDFATST